MTERQHDSKTQRSDRRHDEDLEGLVASNEELRSTNEELHSVNEELHSVNEEHQLKINELLEARRAEDEHNHRFLARLSHELRNPLMGLLAASDMLHESDSEQDKAMASDVVRRQTRHMAAMLRDLFDVTRVRQGKFRLTLEPVDLREALNGPLDGATARAAEKNMRVDVKVPDQPLFVAGDITRLRQMATNLLDNAIEHGKPGGTVRIAVAACDSDRAKLTVSDDGQGMDPDQQAQVFEAPSQANGAVAQGGGLGLGLALVRSIVEAHGGTVEAISDGLGRGANFEVELALTAPPPRSPARGARCENEALRVLLVEDEEDNRVLTARALARRGYEVESAANLAQARAALDRQCPDVILTDLGLPDGSGNEVAQYACERTQISPPLLIALSGHASAEDRRQSYAAGFDHHLVKPASIAEVCRYIEAHFE